MLSADLASQIAAGEVVERPSSVVKELVENALDAGANRVEVTISGGGIELIEVSDDGCGIHPEDAESSLLRHATSKLRAFSDLDDLASYGFRGEALPSIASVSRLCITTRHFSQEAGLVLRAEGTTRGEQELCASPVGSTISVRDLFYNVPARRKFLRSSNTESGHVAEVVQDAALTRPDVSFRLIRDGRSVRYFERVPSRRQRVEQVLDEREFLLVEGQRGPVTVEGYIAPIEKARRGALGLKIVINGRPVRDRALGATVAHAFGPLLERGRYPRGVIYLELPRRLVDINVHPQKTEVRFADARAICDALYSIVARGIVGSKAQGPSASPAPPARGSISAPTAESRESVAASAAIAVDPAPGRASAARASLSGGGNRRERPPISGQRFDGLSTPGGTVNARRPTSVELSTDSEADEARLAPLFGGAAVEQVNQVLRGAERAVRGLKLLGQAQDSFLVCSTVEGICVLDQHAADEIGIFLRLNQAYRSGGLQSQALLFPTALSLNKRDTELIDRRAALLLRLGLDVRVRTDKTVSLHGIMGAVKRAAPEATVRAFLEAARGARDEETLVGRFFSSLACQEAVQRGATLSVGDAQTILKGLSNVALDQGVAECSHGRPLLSSTPFSELSRKAER